MKEPSWDPQQSQQVSCCVGEAKYRVSTKKETRQIFQGEKTVKNLRKQDKIASSENNENQMLTKTGA